MGQVIAIIDYGSGNLRSVEKAFARAARQAGLAARVCVTDDPDVIGRADRLVLPGVGAFTACMDGLRARDGVVEALEQAVLVHARPFLGICVGMQLLAERGFEFGEHAGLGWIPGDVRQMELADPALSCPHMGWNVVTGLSHRPIPQSMDGAAFYFAHSFHFVPENDMHALCVTHHGGPIVAAVRRDNILGLQFHPEKSQSAGLAVINAFLTWTPDP